MTRRGLTVAGFPVRVHPTFFLTAALLGGQQPLPELGVWIAVVLISVLLHELGHALTFRAFGVGTEIELHMMGGLTRPVAGAGLNPLRQLAVSVAGPAGGLAVGLVLVALTRSVDLGTGLAAALVRDAVFANIAWSLINLLPILPLDGGHAMASLLGMASRRNTEPLAQAISVATVTLLVVWSLANHRTYTAVVIGVFWLAGASSYWQRRSALRDAPQGERLKRGWERLREGSHGEAGAIARETLPRCRSAAIRTEAARLLAWSGVAAGDPAVAQEGLALRPRRAPAEPYLEGLVALTAGHHADAVRQLTDAFAAAPGDRTAGPLAQALILSGRPEDAISLLSGPHAPVLGPDTSAAVIEALRRAGMPERAAALEGSDGDVKVHVEQDQRPGHHGQQGGEEGGDGGQGVEEVVTGGHDHPDHAPDDPARGGSSSQHMAG